MDRKSWVDLLFFYINICQITILQDNNLTNLIQCATSQDKRWFRYFPVLLSRWSLHISWFFLHDSAFYPSTMQQLLSRISSFHTSITPVSSPPALTNAVPPPLFQFRSLPQSSFSSFIILTVFLFSVECLLLIKHRLLLFNFKALLHESFPTLLSTIKMSLPPFGSCVTSL